MATTNSPTSRWLSRSTSDSSLLTISVNCKHNAGSLVRVKQHCAVSFECDNDINDAQKHEIRQSYQIKSRVFISTSVLLKAEYT